MHMSPQETRLHEAFSNTRRTSHTDTHISERVLFTHRVLCFLPRRDRILYGNVQEVGGGRPGGEGGAGGGGGGGGGGRSPAQFQNEDASAARARNEEEADSNGRNKEAHVKEAQVTPWSSPSQQSSLPYTPRNAGGDSPHRSPLSVLNPKP
jgi:hypothetical protein